MSATQAVRIMNLRAALASIAGGTPAHELMAWAAIDQLQRVQMAAEKAIEDDDRAAKEDPKR
jgi:hypothetical protein